jgi:hypothetical protein
MTIHDEIFQLAIADGCQPFWWDGIYGWAWHCNCDNEAHFCDSQCSMITKKSATSRARHGNCP